MAGSVPEVSASSYLRNQIIEEAVYESAATGRHLEL